MFLDWCAGKVKHKAAFGPGKMDQYCPHSPQYICMRLTTAFSLRLIPLIAALLPRFDQVAKAGKAPLKAEINCPDGAMTLLADNHFGPAVQTLHIVLPSGHFIEFIIAWFFALFVIFFAEHEHHHIGILLD